MSSTLHRTPLTWLMYGANGASAFFVYSVGPATPLIANDLGISTQVASLHGTAMAAAMLTTGAVAPRSIARWGRLGTVVAMMLSMMVGVTLVLVAPVVAVSLLGAFLAGTGGGVAAVAANATLADVHADAAPTVLTEANASAGWVGLLAPLLMGVFLQAGMGWRVGLAVSVPLCATVAVLAARMLAQRRSSAAGVLVAEPGPSGDAFEVGMAHAAEVEVGAARVDPLPRATAPQTLEAAPEPSRRIAGAPIGLWIVMVAVFAAAGAEFAVNYWGSSLLSENTTAAQGTVTAVMSAPVAGIAVGRTLGARIALRVPAHVLLTGGWLIALAGFLLFWPAGQIAVAGLGLFVIGLGLSVLYPLLLDRAVLWLPERPDRAIAIASPFIGVAIGVAPFGLGALAEVTSISAAFLVVPVILAIGLVAVTQSRPPARG